MSKKNPIGRGVSAVKGWMLKVSHHVTVSGDMDARKPGSDRRIRDQVGAPDRRDGDRRSIA
jgi:hypothetical protein